jgi:hypothetical protein
MKRYYNLKHALRLLIRPISVSRFQSTEKATGKLVTKCTNTIQVSDVIAVIAGAVVAQYESG